MDKNNLYYLCSVIESIAQKNNTTKKEVVQTLGDDGINHIYMFADTYHSLPIAQATDEIIIDFKIPTGNETGKKLYIWDSGSVYSRLIQDISTDNWIDSLKEVYNSWICEYIDDPKLPIYYQSRGYIKECYLEKEIL